MATRASPELDESDSSNYELHSSENTSSVDDDFPVWCSPPWKHLGKTYGKWLVFALTGELDETWHTISQCVESGEFGKGCTGAECLENDPDEKPIQLGSSTDSVDGVIEVSTTKHGMEEVGIMIINKLKRDIQYRQKETKSPRRSDRYQGKPSLKTWLYWNDGEPSFGCRTHAVDINPTTITNKHWVQCKPPSAPAGVDHGKWQVFVPMVSLDEMWHWIRRAVDSGGFGNGCIGAWCSTALKPDHAAPGSNGVIEISTTKEGMEEVGMKLINKVERDIQYRHNVDTRADRYRRKGPMKTWLSWNNGEPSFGHHRTRRADVNPTSITDDHWVHCQPPSAPAYGARDSSKVHGKWQIFEPMVSLDKTWHTIRKAVESGEFGKRCVDARCSTALRPKHMAPDSDGVIEISTTREGMDKIGVKLINKVERDIQYQYEEVKSPSGANRYRWRGPTKISLYWNDGKPSYSDSANPTSITDKHWVRCNPPSAPVAAYHGKWLVFVRMVSLDKTWHRIRRAVESGELGSQCIGAQCSTALRPDHMHSNSDGVIQVSTTKEGMEEVGMKLIEKIKRNILYQPKEFEGTHRADRYDQSRPVRLWLYWNGGKPSFK